MLRSLTFVAGVLLLCMTVQAQSPYLPQVSASRILLSGVAGVDHASFVPLGNIVHGLPGDAPRPAEVTAVSHHRVATGALLWTVPRAYQFGTDNISMISMNQRFTLPFDEGYLDSARMYLRLPLGEMRFDVMRDTVRFDAQLGYTVHDPNYYSALGQVDTARVNFLQVDTSALTLVRFNGKRVPKNFHIAAMPAVAGGLQSAFITATDTTSTKTFQRGDDVGRMTFLGTSAGNLYLIHFYGVFTSTDQKPLDPNMYMIAYVRNAATTSADGATMPITIALHANHPNPAQGAQTMLPFTLERAGTVTITLHDMMGREIRTITSEYVNAGRHTRSIDVSSLPAGMYMCRLWQDGQVSTRPIHVVR